MMRVGAVFFILYSSRSFFFFFSVGVFLFACACFYIIFFYLSCFLLFIFFRLSFVLFLFLVFGPSPAGAVWSLCEGMLLVSQEIIGEHNKAARCRRFGRVHPNGRATPSYQSRRERLREYFTEYSKGLFSRVYIYSLVTRGPLVTA